MDHSRGMDRKRILPKKSRNRVSPIHLNQKYGGKNRKSCLPNFALLFLMILKGYMTVIWPAIIAFRLHTYQNLPGKLGQQSAICWNSLGLSRDSGLNHILFLGINLFLFFKIENWNSQHLFKNKVFETSQNVNSFRLFLFTFFLSVVWLSWNFVRFPKIQFQTDTKSFSFLYWKTKKFYS